MNNCKVSVIITAHNYGKFLPQAVGSVLNQTFEDYECIIVNDGSTDNTEKVLNSYSDVEKIRIIQLNGLGLAKAANTGIKASSGDYIIRLDADDYFDENILLILSSVLDKKPEYGMVYPDYYKVDRYGQIIDQVRQQKVNDEVKLLDRSALAAGSMYRRGCYDAIEGYREELSYQEDYDFWIRFIEKFHVYNVQLPLMYYRKHSSSMSTNTEKRKQAHQYVKEKFVSTHRKLTEKNILCFIPMIAENRYKCKLPIFQMMGKPLFSYALEEAKKINLFDRIIVDTEDEEIAQEVEKYNVEVPYIRPRELAKLATPPVEVLKHMVKKMHLEYNYKPDIIVMLYFNNIFINKKLIEEAINTLLIYKCDSVISVREDIKFHWQPGQNGLKPILYPRKLVREQKWITYEEGGGIYVFDVNNLKTENFLGNSISFIEVNEKEFIRIDSDFHYKIACQILRDSLGD